MEMSAEKKYTVDEFYSMDLPERCELINGVIVDMSPSPNIKHQSISMFVSSSIYEYIRKHKGKCKVLSAPADVKLDNNIIVQPDIYVTCDPDKLNKQFHNGAPDWVIEITSPSTALRDCIEKLSLYKTSGVREYWIIDTEAERVVVYYFEKTTSIELYTFTDNIPVHIYKDNPEPLTIRIADYLD